MVKKIIDIIEKEKVSFQEKKQGFFNKLRFKPFKKKTTKTKKGEKRVAEKNRKGKKSTNKKINLNWLIIGSALILVCFIIFILLSLQAKTEVTLTPRLTEIELKGDFDIKTTALGLDLENKQAQAKFFDIEEEKWQIFPSTGSDDSGTKASGYLFVYNEQIPSRAFSFVKGTRFVSSSGAKTFKSLEKVDLPAAKMEGGNLVPGKVKIKVEAQEPGESYNIGPSKFSVPGLSGTAFYYSVYGEAVESFTGGSSSVKKVVSEQDLESSKDSLRTLLEEQAQSSLVRFLEDGYILPDKSIIFSDFQAECFKQAGDKADDFNCYGKIKARGLALLYQDALALLEQAKNNLVGNEKIMQEESISLSLFAKSPPTQEGEALISFLAKVKVFQPVDQKKIISDLAGKTKSEIETLISEDYPYLQKAEIKISPFWLRRTSDDLSKIKVNFLIKD
ncbi:hypothetical protein FJ208_00360 [Candidatus Gribaldobacteria bacterium]|nr:hypothetical protein [Candidatus Gribaldobacteria bacterium]